MPDIGEPIPFPWGVTYNGRFRNFRDGSGQRNGTWADRRIAESYAGWIRGEKPEVRVQPTKPDPTCQAVPVPIVGTC